MTHDSTTEQKTKNNVRFSERAMQASCPFANSIAQCALAAFHRQCPNDLRDSFQQTVLAAFVLCDERRSSKRDSDADGTTAASVECLRCLCIGVGTKFLQPSAFMVAEDEYDDKDDNADQTCGKSKVVRDLHAEVLARRAFQLVLLDEIKKSHNVLHRSQDSEKEECPSVSSSFLEPVPKNNHHHYDDDHDHDQAMIPTRFHLAPGCSIHFYTSSQPCGNACIKRWGSGASSRRKPVPPNAVAEKSSTPSLPERRDREHDDHIGSSTQEEDRRRAAKSSGSCCWSAAKAEHPDLLRPHAPLHVVQRNAGQVALLVKQSIVAKRDSNNNDGDCRTQEESERSSVFPTGTQLATREGEWQIPCCSGKIAAWNALRCWEGEMLHRAFFFADNNINNSDTQEGQGGEGGGIVPETIVIGRKFSAVHAQRALCCRVDLKRQLLSKHDRREDSEFQKKCNDDGDAPNSHQEEEKKKKKSADDHHHHPVLMSTSKKFDDSVRRDDDKANFEESRCFAWWRVIVVPAVRNNSATDDDDDDDDDGVWEELSGRSGRVLRRSMQKNIAVDSLGCSMLTTDFLVQSFQEAVVLSSGVKTSAVISAQHVVDSIRRSAALTMTRNTEQREARLHSLLNHPLLFHTWPRCDVLDTFL